MDQSSQQVSLYVNFKNVQFDNPKRITEQNARGGKAYMFWRSKDMYSNDITTLSITGDSGNFFNPDHKQDENIGEQVENALDKDKQASEFKPEEKRKMFFQLFALTREKHFNDDGTENIFYIKYKSALFADEIVFNGHFDSGLQYSDMAENPFHVEFNVNFKVYYTEPDLSEYWSVMKQQ
jgi:hypothetical protein